MSARKNQHESLKAWLQQYRDAVRVCENLDCRIENLRDRLLSPSSARLDDTPHAQGYDADRIGAALAQIEELEEECRELRRQARELYREIDCTINRISGPGWPDMQAVLRMRYLDGEKWEMVTGLLFGSSPNYDERQESYLRRVHKLHSAALAAICEFAPIDRVQKNDEQEEKEK